MFKRILSFILCKKKFPSLLMLILVGNELEVGRSMTEGEPLDVDLKERITEVFPVEPILMLKSKRDQNQFICNISLVFKFSYLVVLKKNTFYNGRLLFSPISKLLHPYNRF